MKEEKPGILAQLAIKHGSDKWGHHYYCNNYEKHLQRFRDKPVNLLELGVGGYHRRDKGASGLRMWYNFFLNKETKIHGVDIYDKSLITLPPGIKIHKGSQDDERFLLTLMKDYGVPLWDIVIDDASHINSKTLKSFEILFPLLTPGGIYIIEDIETSWWEAKGADGTDFGGCGDAENFHCPTAINMGRALVNAVNSKHIAGGTNEHNIKSIHFYDNCIIIEKGG